MRQRLSILIALVFVIACEGATDPESKLALTLTSDRTSLSAGDTAHLTLTIANRSSVTIPIPSSSCGPFFTVTDAAGRSSGPPVRMCDLALRQPVELAAGQRLTLYDVWAADSGNASAGRTLRVQPGTYTIRGIAAGPTELLTSKAIAVQVNGTN